MSLSSTLIQTSLCPEYPKKKIGKRTDCGIEYLFSSKCCILTCNPDVGGWYVTQVDLDCSSLKKINEKTGEVEIAGKPESDFWVCRHGQLGNCVLKQYFSKDSVLCSCSVCANGKWVIADIADPSHSTCDYIGRDQAVRAANDYSKQQTPVK